VAELLPPGPQLGVFVGAVLVLALTPGPALFYILATSIAQGTRSGLVSVVGIATGTFVHVLLAVFGLTLLLASSAAVFQLVKYSGVLYLVALGVYVLMRPKQEEVVVSERPARDLWRVYSHASW
jgi:threonine/homoserine/homoserine lactone efflux protein